MANQWKATYTINGAEYTQTSLTPDQVFDLSEMVWEVRSDFPKKLDLPPLLKFLRKHNLLNKFIGIILVGEKPLPAAIPATQVLEVLNDFLASSETLSIITQIFLLINQAGVLMEEFSGKLNISTLTTSSPSSPTVTSASTGTSAKK